MEVKLQSKSTPGPWKHDVEPYDQDGLITGPDGEGIAQVYNSKPNSEFFHQENAANARLITAAPDLVAALAEALEWCAIDAVNEDGFPSQEMLDNRVDVLKAALRKATGGKVVIKAGG